MTIVIKESRMKTMAAGVFKTKCLAVMDEVQSKRETVVITKRGKPVAKLVPIDSAKDDLYGYMKGKGKITGDVVRPVLTLKEWGNLA
jgi:prevent-host-death family protein